MLKQPPHDKKQHKLALSTQRMSNNTQYIEQLCRELRSDGKTPSVGLVRSRATKKLAVREVIEVLKHWKDNSQSQDGIQTTPEINPSPSQSLEERVEQLETEVFELKNQLKSLLNNPRG